MKQYGRCLAILHIFFHEKFRALRHVLGWKERNATFLDMRRYEWRFKTGLHGCAYVFTLRLRSSDEPEIFWNRRWRADKLRQSASQRRGIITHRCRAAAFDCTLTNNLCVISDTLWHEESLKAEDVSTIDKWACLRKNVVRPIYPRGVELYTILCNLPHVSGGQQQPTDWL